MYTVLVCDDDKAILDSLEIYLTHDGYKVLKAVLTELVCVFASHAENALGQKREKMLYRFLDFFGNDV